MLCENDEADPCGEGEGEGGCPSGDFEPVDVHARRLPFFCLALRAASQIS